MADCKGTLKSQISFYMLYKIRSVYWKLENYFYGVWSGEHPYTECGSGPVACRTCKTGRCEKHGHDCIEKGSKVCKLGV